jgi:beta-galactosidase
VNALITRLLLCLVGITVAQSSFAQAPARERLLLDFGWKFHLGNQWGIAQNLAKAGTGSGPASTSFSDASWRTVNLPHDWAIELPFDQKADGSHGFKALGNGFESNSVAWYRRTFELPKEDLGKRIWLEFDGAFRDTAVFVNGWYMGRHESGYSNFRFDITDVVNCGGKNVVSVKVDATESEGWFYEGAGIYRHVWLVKTAPLAIAPDGVFVYSTFPNNIPDGPATIHAEVTVNNSFGGATNAIVTCDVLTQDGTRVAQVQEDISIGGNSGTARLTTTVESPALWSPESPKLYRLVTSISAGEKVVDRIETEFGIRTVAFDADRGFFLNGKPYVIKGTCNHQDHAGVGAALPDRLQYFRIGRLKEMGGNAYRASHNPPTPELLEACDRLGMLVMDEQRLIGSDAMNLDRLERLILRDRNHPSVFSWCIGNEEFYTQATPAGARVGAAMQARVKELDPTRPVTYAANMGNSFEGLNTVIEVRGWNYHIGETNTDVYHKEHPTQPNVGTEQGSTVSTRGIYANDKERGYVSAYDDNAPSWGRTAESWWTYFVERPWLSGAFVWTGFDYRGEPTPYSWPCINSHFGILDTCGFPKDNFYYYRAWWSDQQVLHILPHWNWPGKTGEEIDVRVLSNCDEVELFLNNQSLGRQTMKRNSHLKWKVKYAPGNLEAVGYKSGAVVGRTKTQTAGEPAHVQLTPDRKSIKADGEDISIITVASMDSQNQLVPTATNLVHFELEGPGKIIGVGNGDPSCHEADVYLSKWPVRSIPIGGWRWQKIANPYNTNFAERAEQFEDSSWPRHDATAASGPLAEREHGVFRTRVNVSAQDLAAEAVELSIGMVDQDGWAYVNGHAVGESRDWKVAAVFDIRRYLKPGENTIAVAVANWDGAGGINKGTHLQFMEKPTPVQWKRSVFNGLAQIIVQGTKEPGEIKLTAKSGALTPSTLVIRSEAFAPRPSVP